MDQQFEIRQAGIEDVQIIKTLALETFRETYGPNASPGNLEKYINEHFSAERLSAELQSADNIFFIAFIGNTPVGFTKITLGKTTKGLAGSNDIKLERIYVLKAYQGLSIGKELMKKVLSVAREKKANHIWLLVWQKNEKAIQFYRKAGFVIFETEDFVFGDEIHQDFIMKMDLYY